MEKKQGREGDGEGRTGQGEVLFWHTDTRNPASSYIKKDALSGSRPMGQISTTRMGDGGIREEND